MDSTSLRVPYYARVLDTLYCIYRVVSNATFTSMNHLISSQTAILLKFSIGWFFALPNFPADLYVSCQSAYVKRDLKSLCPSEEVLHWMSDKKQQFVVSSNVAKTRLDKLDIIDDELLYTCCPFLSEFRILLLSGNANFSGTTTNRHITPVTSQLKKAITGKDLQVNLMILFFFYEPMVILQFYLKLFFQLFYSYNLKKHFSMDNQLPPVKLLTLHVKELPRAASNIFAV